MALTLRLEKGYELTYAELDGNFTFITSSFLSTASFNDFMANASITGSLNGTASYALTASYVDLANLSSTASYALTASYVDLAVLSSTASYALTASYIDSPNITANNITVINDIVIGNNGTINGQNILTTADASQFVTSVNGIFPTAGNVSVSLTAVLTGTSASLAASSSGAVTGSLANGVLWVVSGDATPANNGDAYIFQSGSVGQWLTVAPFDLAVGDARYVLQYGDGAITGSFVISGSGVTVDLKGDTTISGSLRFEESYGVNDLTNRLSIDPNVRELYDINGTAVINWENYDLIDPSGVRSIDWEDRQLKDYTNNISLNWDDREYYYPNENTAISLGTQDVIKVIGLMQLTGSMTQGENTTAIGNYSHAEGTFTSAAGNWSHAEGSANKAIGDWSHAEGGQTTAKGDLSHAEGNNTKAVGIYSHSEGINTLASGAYSHAEGLLTIASGAYSHAEGSGSISLGIYSHAEGIDTDAIGISSHAEGWSTTAVGQGSHSEGISTVAIGTYSHAEGDNTTAKGTRSHAEGWYTIAGGAWSHAQGVYNLESSNDFSFIIGNGTDGSNRSNLLYASGSQVQVTGSLAISGSVSTGNGTIILPGLVLASYADDTTAAAAGIPIGGLYRNGSFIQIRLV
jgi:hypothetical protein